MIKGIPTGTCQDQTNQTHQTNPVSFLEQTPMIPVRTAVALVIHPTFHVLSNVLFAVTCIYQCRSLSERGDSRECRLMTLRDGHKPSAAWGGVRGSGTARIPLLLWSSSIQSLSQHWATHGSLLPLMSQTHFHQHP